MKGFINKQQRFKLRKVNVKEIKKTPRIIQA